LEGWQTLFLLEALPALIFAVMLLRWFCDDPAQATFLNADEKKWLLDQYKRECHAKLETRHYTVMQALCDPKVLKLCLIYFLWITGFWGFGYWMPSVLKALSGWSDLALGWMVVPPMCLSLGFMLWIGHRSSVTGEKRFHGAIGLFIGAVGLLLGTSFDNPWLSYLMLCMAAVGVYAPFGVWWSYPTTFLTGSAAAGAIGMINSFGNIGGFVGPYCIGWLKETSGGYTLGWVYLGLSLALAGCLMLTLRHTPRDL
jgi:predicted MFS family arabinose efflux permease